MTSLDSRGAVDRFIDGIEMTAAIFLAVVTFVTFVSVFLRYLFAWSIPDSYDISSLLLGILIFWGIASASYRGEHISVDLLHNFVPTLVRRAIDTFADIVTLGALIIFTWMVAIKVINTMEDNVATFDLRQPVWIYYFIAWIGLAAAIVLMIARTLRTVLSRQVADDQYPKRSIE
jgi:TRAP-type C4-dicarboxylate transport system permease small subunit